MKKVSKSATIPGLVFWFFTVSVPLKFDNFFRYQIPRLLFLNRTQSLHTMNLIEVTIHLTPKTSGVSPRPLLAGDHLLPRVLWSTCRRCTQRSGPGSEMRVNVRGDFFPRSCEVQTEVSVGVPWSHRIVHPHPMVVDCTGIWICSSLGPGLWLGLLTPPRSENPEFTNDCFGCWVSILYSFLAVLRLYNQIVSQYHGSSQLGHGGGTTF